MSTETGVERTTEPQGFLSPPARAVLILFIVSGLVIVAFVMLVGSAHKNRLADVSADLKAKYGLTVVGFPNTRLSQPAIWTIDGAERNCVYLDDALKCLDGDGAYTEIGRTR